MLWQIALGRICGSTGGGAAIGGGGGGATARSAQVMGPMGPVMINTSTTQRDANADGVMVNSR